MSKPTTSFPSHAHMTIIRQESQLRKTALCSFGPQGVLDLALLGAILGNNIREIGRYRITCDGQLVQGRYTIYELVHFGVLSVTGRQSSRSRRQHRRRETMGRPSSTESTHSSDSSTTTTTSTNNNSTTTKSKGASSQRIYPAMLANLFPQLVFKALRQKSIRPPKFQHDDSANSPTFPSVFTCDDIPEDRATPAPLDMQASSSLCSDPMLITSEKVLADLIQKRLHRVKDLPLPRELCFLGAVSLPLPSVLRPMHVAWTMDFLNTRATTVRRQHQQKQQQGQEQEKKSSQSTCVPTGGLDFRPDIYAHKMRLARLARAQQQQRRAAARSAMGEDHSTASASSIPEEDEEEEEEKVADEKKKTPSPPQDIRSTNHSIHNKDKAVRQDRRLMQQLLTLESKVPRLVRQWSTAARSCFSEELNQEDRQVQDWVDRQRIQVVLGSGYRFGGHSSSTNSPTASSSSSSSLFSLSSTNAPLSSTAGPGPLAKSNRCLLSNKSMSSSSRPRPILKPIATTLANAAYTNHTSHGRYASSPMFGTPRTPPAPAVGAVVPSPTRLSHSLPLSGTTTTLTNAATAANAATTTTRMCFSEGIRLGSSPARAGGGVAITVHNSTNPATTLATTATGGGAAGRTGGEEEEEEADFTTTMVARSRPASGGGLQDRLSVSQQMLSMHLWLSLLVSPISPKHMIQDQFSFMDSQL
ncbi:hypothetical protein BGZ70_004267 [Mortierella alpina]|uniref:Uncharacterized protein n=1 Tax=Mortierella alpina TaxID=64518 RepID=A0A9P6J9W1_MORAP|nr:hypothetical protein BGZ70_004267 [Mortierella alpina]